MKWNPFTKAANEVQQQELESLFPKPVIPSVQEFEQFFRQNLKSLNTFIPDKFFLEFPDQSALDKFLDMMTKAGHPLGENEVPVKKDEFKVQFIKRFFNQPEEQYLYEMVKGAAQNMVDQNANMMLAAQATITKF